MSAETSGLGKRDYIPLSIAIFVDFCLLLVSVSRPINGFRRLENKMAEAQNWPIIQILARFREIHSDEDIRTTFDIFRHVVFDYARDYYVAAQPLQKCVAGTRFHIDRTLGAADDLVEITVQGVDIGLHFIDAAGDKAAGERETVGIGIAQAPARALSRSAVGARGAFVAFFDGFVSWRG